MVSPPSRFAMTPPPQAGGDPGKYHEALVQWLLEHTFFLDFVYRNPAEHRGQGELADAIVLFDDVALMVQVKAQFSQRHPARWARKELKRALKQLRHTKRMLFGGHVHELENPLFGRVPFDASLYGSQIGLIVLAQRAAPFSAEVEVPELAQLDFPVHVLSLRDFLLLIERFDTAGDLVPYLELRHDMRAALDRRVHAEAVTLRQISDRIGEFMKVVRPAITPELLQRTVRYFRSTAFGGWGDEYRYSLAIDDIIAHLHNGDVSLPWNSRLAPNELAKVTAPLAWLDRRRRIALGKMLLEMCEDAARDGQVHYNAHFQPSLRVGFVFVVSAEPREKRVRHLPYLVEAAHAEFDADIIIGIATGPLGNGRSYDLCYREGSVAAEVKEYFQKEGSPFKDFTPLFE
jgi:hypothetical protein